MKKYVVVLYTHYLGTLIVKEIPKRIQLSKMFYYEHMADRLGITTEALESWGREGRGLPEKYSYDEIKQALTDTVNVYLSDSSIQKTKQLSVKANWEHYCPIIFSELENIMVDFKETIDENVSIDLLKGRYDKLSPESAYTLYSCFDALCGTTWNDLTLIAAMTKSKTQKVFIENDLNARIKSHEVLSHLNIDQAQQWQKLLNRHSTTRDKSEIWDKIQSKAKLLKCKPIELNYLLDLFGSGANDTTALVDESRFGQNELNLFLLFKYCLTENEQKEVLENIHTV